MDPVTISSLLAAAAGALGSEAVKDLYEVAKQAIKNLFGQDEDLLEVLASIHTISVIPAVVELAPAVLGRGGNPFSKTGWIPD